MTVHLKVPFEIEGGRARTVKHDSLDEITQNVAVLLGTRTGQRLTEPEFGISDPTFALAPDTGEIEGAIARFEPRAQVSIDVIPGEEAHVTVKVARR